MDEDRSWMYTGRTNRGQYTEEWMDKTTAFVDWAFARDTGSNGVLCPCGRCSNKQPQTRATMIAHLCNHGFRPGYTVWVYHGELIYSKSSVLRQHVNDEGAYNTGRMNGMIDDF
jgi:hypothetical protein